MSTVVGNDGLEGTPSLQSICDLFRSVINDTFSDGAGQIATDTAPFMKPFLNSAIRDLYSDLRIVGDMKVVKDNFLINGIPPIPATNPEVQVALTYQGYFDGTSWNPNLLLPPDLMWVNKVWQRPSRGLAGSGGGSGGTPLYFRARCALTGGAASVALASEPSGDSTSLTASGTEIALVSLANQTELDIAISVPGGGGPWVGTVYFEASVDGNTWYSTSPGSTSEQTFSTSISLPLPNVGITAQASTAGISDVPFLPMEIAPDGLSGGCQGQGLGRYEVRGNNEIWFNGALLSTDIRLRYAAVFPDIIGDAIDFDTTYVPIQDCTNAVAFKMVAYYAQRLSPDQFQLAESQAQKFTKKLIAESVLNSQTKEFERISFGSR